MKEPENLVLRLLRELRADMDRKFGDMDRKFGETDDRFRSVEKRLDSQSQAITGESVMGRYTVAEVEEQLAAIRERLDGLEAK